MSTIKLYFADWCGYCKRFKPTWDQLKPFFEQNNINYFEYDVDTSDGKQQIEKDNVGGFPTIRIKKSSEDEYEYEGDRSVEAIQNELVPMQRGGNSLNNQQMKEKYLRYKNKYYSLKKSLGKQLGGGKIYQ